ncbi:MAG TPA: restriction endonuclease [Candidatus Nanoarchaeia archaeon]|nr:restriction endonuclease [Candidatus Nanoarchaeia archaeon]
MKIVIKRNGEYQPFKLDKIIRTCLRTGLSQRDAERIALRVEQSFGETIKAKELYEKVLAEIEGISQTACARYQLKESIAKIDPEVFEHYVMKVLEANGYECIWNRIIWGACIEHQVDILAEKDKVTWLVECKHHVRDVRDTGLGEVLQVWARLTDIKDGIKLKKNDIKNPWAWMITNTKFSAHAIKYALAKQLRLSGWGSSELSFQRLIESVHCYPTTILGLPPKMQERCEHADLLTILDIQTQDDKARDIFGKEYADYMNQIKCLMA